MIGRLNHVAIAVPDLAAAAAVYRGALGAKVSDPVPLPEHGVTTVFVTLPNSKIELIAPLGDNSPIAKFPRAKSGRRHPSRLLRGGRYPRDARSVEVAGSARARRWRAEDRCARQARAVPAPKGFRGHARRDGAGVNHVDLGCPRDLLRDLVDGAVCRASVGRAESARGRDDGGRHRSGRATAPAVGPEGDRDDV